MKGKRRAEADHTPRHELGRLGKRVVGIERRAGKLIKPAAELHDDALLLHARHGGRRDAVLDELGQASHAPLREQRDGLILLALGGVFHAASMVQYIA